MRAKDAVKSAIPPAVRALFQARRVRCFVVGAEKTGTTSLAGTLAHTLRAAHEPLWTSTVADMFAHYSNNLQDRAFARRLERRDRLLWLEAESSCLLGYCAPFLTDIFGDAKFVLTIRPWQSWLKSAINHHLTHRRGDRSMGMWYAIAYEPHRFTYRLHDSPLEVRDLFPVRSYLGYWRKSIEWVVQSVPRDRLMVLPTPEISRSAGALEAFLELPSGSLRTEDPIIRNKAEQDHGVFGQLDSNYLEDCAGRLCADYAHAYLSS